MDETVKKFFQLWLDVERKAFAENVNADVTFVVDGHDVKANRGQLEKYSDVLKTLFENDYERNGGKFELKEDDPMVLSSFGGHDLIVKRSKLNDHFSLLVAIYCDDVKKIAECLTLKEINREIFCELVLSCYTGMVNIKNCDFALELFKLAHQLNVGFVKQFCEQYVDKTLLLTKENVVNVFAIGDLYGSELIKNSVLNRVSYLNWSFNGVKDIEKLTGNQFKLLCEAMLAKVPFLDSPSFIEPYEISARCTWSDIEHKSFVDEKNKDVIFVLDDTELKARRASLEKHSDVFKAMFENDYDKLGGRFVINGMDYGIFTRLIWSCNTGVVDVNNCETALELFKLSHQYNVKFVQLYCEEYIRCNQVLTGENVATYLAFADCYGSSVIKELVLTSIVNLNCSFEELKNLEKLTQEQTLLVMSKLWSVKEREKKKVSELELKDRLVLSARRSLNNLK